MFNRQYTEQALRGAAINSAVYNANCGRLLEALENRDLYQQWMDESQGDARSRWAEMASSWDEMARMFNIHIDQNLDLQELDQARIAAAAARDAGEHEIADKLEAAIEEAETADPEADPKGY
jgi:hypothetical protein